METAILVQIHLNHPAKDQHGTVLNFLFNEQPQVQDIVEAYANDPLLRLMHDYDVFGGVLTQCLNTYGVPQLNKMNLTDKDGYWLAIPLVQAEWRANIGSRTDYAMNHCFGSIRLLLRTIKTVQKCGNELDRPAERKGTRQEGMKVKTKGVKARSNASRGLPTVDPKTGLPKSPPIKPRKRGAK